MSRRSVIRPSPATFSYGRQRSFLKRETPHEGTGSGRFCLLGIPLLTFFPHPTRVSRGCGSVGRASPCQGEGRGFESRHPLGRLAQRERASLTRKRSLVRSQYRPPALEEQTSPEHDASDFFLLWSGFPAGRGCRGLSVCSWWCVSPRDCVPVDDYGGNRLESCRMLPVAARCPTSGACSDRDVSSRPGNGACRCALPSGEELVPAARNGWL